MPAEEKRAFDGIGEFSDVSRPGVSIQNRHGFVAEAHVRRARSIQEMLKQDGQVFHAGAQRRDGDGDHVQPIVQVLA